jgi:hypothetical protein
VGYGKPPRKNRFQSGQSGNPKGRPKGAKSHKAMLQNLLKKKVQVKINGEIQSISTLEAVFKSLVSVRHQNKWNSRACFVTEELAHLG